MGTTQQTLFRTRSFPSVSECPRPGRTTNFLKALGWVGDGILCQLYMFGYFFLSFMCMCTCMYGCLHVGGAHICVNMDMSMHVKACGCDQV